MRNYILGGLGIALTTSISFTAGNALAFSDYDGEVSAYDFFTERASFSSNELREDEKEIIAKIQELRKEARSGDRREEAEKLELEIKLLELEKEFGEELTGRIRTRLGSRTEWSKIAEADQSKVENAVGKALAEIEADPSKLPASPEVAVHQLEDYPIEIVQRVDFKKGRDGKLRAYVAQELRLSQQPRSDWPRSWQRKFEELTDDEIVKFLDDNVNPTLSEEAFEIGKLEDLKKPEWKAKAFEDFKRDLARHVTSDVFGSNASSAIKNGVGQRLDQIGSKAVVESQLGELEDELSYLKDPKRRKNEEEALRAKLKLARALRTQPDLRAELENSESSPCETIIKIIGEDEFKKLAPSSQMGCDTYLRKKEAEIAEKEAEEEVEEEIEKQDKAKTEVVHNRFMQLVQHCRAKRQMMANKNMASPIERLIEPMYNGLQASGASCTYFGSFMGRLSSSGAADDLALANMFDADPLMMSGFGDSGFNSFETEAQEHISDVALPSQKGTEKLQEQIECLGKMASLSSMALQKVASSNPSGLMHPELANDDKIQQMIKYKDAAAALHKAAIAELRLRKQSGMGGMRALASTDSQQGRAPLQAINPGSQFTGTAVPVRTLNSADSLRERGMSGTIRNQRNVNQGARRAPAGNPPPPNFLGQ